MYVCPGWAQRAHGQASFTGSENMGQKQRRVKGYIYQLQLKASEGSQSACYNFSERNIHTPDTSCKSTGLGMAGERASLEGASGYSAMDSPLSRHLTLNFSGCKLQACQENHTCSQHHAASIHAAGPIHAALSHHNSTSQLLFAHTMKSFLLCQ